MKRAVSYESLLFDESSISALVDVEGSTFATTPNKFVTLSSGTLVFIFTGITVVYPGERILPCKV